MKNSKLQIFYFFAAILGFCVTWYFNLQTPNVGFIKDMYATSASTSIANDLSVVVAVFLVWSFVETGRLKISYWWWSVCFICTFLIAAATTVPLYFLLRERRLAELKRTNGAQPT